MKKKNIKPGRIEVFLDEETLKNIGGEDGLELKRDDDIPAMEWDDLCQHMQAEIRRRRPYIRDLQEWFDALEPDSRDQWVMAVEYDAHERYGGSC